MIYSYIDFVNDWLSAIHSPFQIQIVNAQLIKYINVFRSFIEEKLGTKYVEGRNIEFAKSYEESGPGTPMFFILSAGVDPLKDVEALGKKLGFSTDANNFHNISLGQGQEIVAERAIDLGGNAGHWVILQVIFQFSILPLSVQHPDKKVDHFGKLVNGYLWD